MWMEIVSVFKLDRQYFRSSLRYLEPLPSLINPANALHIAMLVGEGMRGEGKYPLCYQFVLRAYANRGGDYMCHRASFNRSSNIF